MNFIKTVKTIIRNFYLLSKRNKMSKNLIKEFRLNKLKLSINRILNRKMIKIMILISLLSKINKNSSRKFNLMMKRIKSMKYLIENLKRDDYIMVQDDNYKQ